MAEAHSEPGRPVDPADPAVAELITRGDLEVRGRIVDASNLTVFGTVELDGAVADVVYKPVSGERPLWDFPDGTLAGREVATALIAEAAEIGRVSPTVLRDGPFGEGMVQLWIDVTERELVDVVAPEELPDDWRVVLRAEDQEGQPLVVAHADDPELRELAILDIVVNNTDRKGGHILPGPDGRIYGIDHGICLHTDPKLRTVLWGWAGEPLGDDVLDKLRKLRWALDRDLGASLSQHLTREEVTALTTRVDGLVEAGTFPVPSGAWRAIPWPLF
ncbi:SCO1664 family protein [Prauserella halophila]|uniref:SCO1664 family protein n=1 Tax=Prauserella halophila TaxID=185641 RepID=A0ABN1W1K3_9PSEU|nr:SCO1664 family protein [Prauserella halophila]MCP2237285.1 hypothetical protein [Prauserella halophila]